MRTFGRIFLILIASIGVSALGYYAYVLAAETLTYPFAGSDKQYGDILEAVVARPRFIVNFSGGPILDEGALHDAIRVESRSGSGDTLVSGEYTLTVSGEHIMLMTTALGEGEKIRIDASEYNEKKSTRYRLPRDLTLSPLSYPRSLTVTSIGLPRDKDYHVSMFGFGEYTPEHMKYYVKYSNTTPCNLSTSWQEMSEIFPTVVRPLTKDGQMMEMDIHFDFNASRPYTCIIGGVNGVYTTLEDRILDEFTVTGSTLEVLSPEYDMQTRIEFRFSSPIYADSGALYSPAYIANRHAAKVSFLKHLSVVPDIGVTPENLVLTPDRAILTLPLKEGEETKISLSDIEDIYGRTVSTKYTITPEQSPFLSLKFKQDKSYYTPSEPLGVKLYALKAPKNTYSIKLCRLPLESYARMERYLSESMTGKTLDSVYGVLHGPDAFNCTKKDIVLTETGYVSEFDIREFRSERSLVPGMYMLTFTNQDDILGFQKPVRPLLFTVMDSHITMKVDASGKMMFLVTDLSTGKPLANQEVRVMRNITRSYIERWNPETSQSEREYLPLTAQAFATGVIIGKTNNDGFLDVSLETLAGVDSYESSPYGLSFESWWEYEGRYESFLVQSQDSSGKLGYLVSTWNDGITGYNFGMKDSDYSWETRTKYTAYLHTERRLYLPGETVHIHGILRENNTTLRVPGDVAFNLVISDTQGREVSRTTLKPNEFGTISADLTLTKDAPLGMYSVSLSTLDGTEYVQNGWANFQVEVFKNPTFTASVELRSPDIENGNVKNLRKKENTDQNNPWYSDVYEGKFALEGIVKSQYYNGAQMKNTPFTYRIYRSDYYESDYWYDCFWGCYYEPPLEYYTEGTGTIDQDGYGVFSVPVAYTSFYDDYKYTAEVTIRDPLSGEEVTTPASLIVKLPQAYKSFSLNNALEFTPKKKILQNNEDLQGTFSPEYGKWDASFAGKYTYEIIRREYKDTPVDDIRAGIVHVTTSSDIVVASGTVSAADFSQKLIAYPAGEYLIRVSPVVASGSAVPEYAISENRFYISGPALSLQGNAIRVIPEKTVYKPGETARVLVTVPFTGSHILLTLEKGGVISHEYFTLSGSSFTREYKVDDTLIPNAYVGVVALHPDTSTGSSNRSYAVGYGEIISDFSEKKSVLTLTPDKQVYKNRDKVTVDLTLADRSGNPLQGEVAVMVVDESLIRILGNIDLDIIPKFFQKYPFTTKTSLSSIGIERNRFLSRKGSNGGSGDKGGGGIEIASRSVFKNTAYYNPSIRTDASGKARFQFDLPDNVTDYRIITIGNTKDSHFAVQEKTIQVRKDYVVESHAPMILRPTDSSRITASVFNSTKRVTPAKLMITIGTGADIISKTVDVTLNPGESVSRDFDFSVIGGWTGNVVYRIDLKEKDILLDSYTSSFRLAPIPDVEATSREILVMTGATFEYSLPSAETGTDMTASRVSVNISSSYAVQLSEAIKSLVQYPYGCIEQTIGSTLPNALALKFSDILGISIDRTQAQENLKAGLSKILRMQHYSGGWTYWEGDMEASSHVTPYVLRTLISFRNLGQTIPDEVLDNGANYIVSNIATYRSSEDDFSEAIWALALVGHKDEALELWKNVDTKKLTRHGYIAYASSARILGTYSDTIAIALDKIVLGSQSVDYYWYWDARADKALYAQLLLDNGEDTKALALLDTLVRSTDLSSYYVSTQAKIQIFRALVKQAERSSMTLSKTLSMAFRSDAVIADASLSKSKNTVTIESNREKIGQKFSLKRDDARVPLYVTVTIRDRTKSILDMPAQAKKGMGLIRTFEKVDESKGRNADGQFVSLSPVNDGIFEKGQLYRVTLKSIIPTNQVVSGESWYTPSWYHLAFEDFYPGGWRPINTRFNTESSLLASNSNDWWSYIESRDDRMLTYIDVGYSKTRTYQYYFRPEIPGTYILPPAMSYFMYQPEVHAFTKYERITVKE